MTHFTTIARTGTLIAIASSLLALTAPAFAAPIDEDALPQATLNVAGTDFTSAKAVDHLKARVRRTALEICVPDGDTRMPMATDQRQCYNTAIRNGLAQIESKQQLAMRKTTVNVASAQTDTHPAH